MRLSGRSLVVLGAIVGLMVIWSTDQIVPAATEYQAQMRLWLVGRASGLAAYLFLTAQVTIGLVLSHPVNQSTWRLSRRLFPWHENAWVFVLAFLAAHIVSLVLDPYAGVGLTGAFIPGLSGYRSWPVALGTLSLYALLITGLTARYTRMLPSGLWLRIHRLSLVVLGLAWAHGVLAGTDSDAFLPLYAVTGLLVIGAAAYRYWVSKRRRPSFATSLPDAPAPPLATPSSRDPDARSDRLGVMSRGRGEP